MRMEIRRAEDETLEFISLTLRVEERPPVHLLDPARADPGREPVPICSWCKRVLVEEEWREVEDAVQRLGLFDTETTPPLTHGICPECAIRVEEEVA
jgi:hypothetical protein